ncbi:MAG: tyrosine-type recombinase/integrase [Ruminococcus sp.]
MPRNEGGKYNNMVSGHLQIKKGYYYVVLSYYDNRNKRHVKYVSTGLPEKGNKRKAEAALARVRSEFEPPQEVGELASNMPFAEYLLEWLDIVKVRVKATTYSSYEVMVKSTLEPYFRKKGYTLQGLEARHIQQFYTEKLKTVKPSSVIHYHAVIHQALKYAMKTDLVTQNVAMKVDRPKRNDYQPVFLDAEELQRLFQVVKGTRLELPVLVAAFYGLRRGEVCGLKWDAIDFERGTITIKHTVTSIQVDGKTKMYAQDSAKTKSSMRTLPLVGSFAEYFKEVKAAQELNKQVCGNCYNYEYDGYVFVDELGDLMKPDYLTAYFPQYIQKHGLKRMRFHDLRHSCASLLLANGVPLKQIQDWLGHSDFSTTANIYAHLDYSSKLSSAQAMVSGMPLPETVDFGNKWAEIADSSRAG